ncbi:MAG: hypothetical protein DRH17_09435 [Deltaproteobacteria bacterium]|nr:MAG: hypothetical protein DRH17_09435 [Deltaproteobacteria bacterium]
MADISFLTGLLSIMRSAAVRQNLRSVGGELHRNVLGLSQAVWKSLKVFLQESIPEDGGYPKTPYFIC